MDRTRFEQLVSEGMERVPAQFHTHLNEIAVVVEDCANTEQRRSSKLRRGEELLGLYEGTPHTERQGLPYRLPDKITLFQNAFEALFDDDEERIREEIASTVWHELAHALGMSERHVRHVERLRRKRKTS